MKRKSGLRRKQGGFIFGLDASTFFIVLGSLLVIALPIVNNVLENNDTTSIVTGYTTIQKAVQDKYPHGNYEDVDMDGIENFLPEGFSKQAVNGQDWDLDVSSSSTNQMTIGLPIPSDRLRAKVLAKLNTDKATESGDTVYLTTR